MQSKRAYCRYLLEMPVGFVTFHLLSGQNRLGVLPIFRGYGKNIEFATPRRGYLGSASGKK